MRLQRTEWLRLIRLRPGSWRDRAGLQISAIWVATWWSMINLWIWPSQRWRAPARLSISI